MNKFFLILFFILINVTNSFSESRVNSYLLIASHVYMDESDKSSEHIFFNIHLLKPWENCFDLISAYREKLKIKEDLPGQVVKCVKGDEITDRNLALTFDEKFLPMLDLQSSDYFYIFYLDHMKNKSIIVDLNRNKKITEKDVNKLIDIFKDEKIKDIYIQYPQEEKITAANGLEVWQRDNPDIDKFEYGKAFVKFLGKIKLSQKRILNILDQNKNNKNHLEVMVSLKEAAKLGLLDLKEGKDAISLFKNSRNSYIRSAVNASNGTFLFLTDLYEQYITGLEILSNPERKNDRKKLKLGNYKKESKKLLIDSDNYLKRILYLSLLTTYILNSEHLGKSGKLDLLALTAQQKEEMLSELDSVFDSKTRNGVKEISSFSNLEASGVVLYEFLLKKNFIPFDKQ